MSVNQYYHELLNQFIPRGGSTSGKRPTYLPEEPAVVVRGAGCRVWDADGREFIDFRNSLGPVTLGYNYEAVNQAIRRQLEDGISFGYPHPLEAELAKQLHEIIPCAEKIRFLKTGGEAIAATIKIARCATGRDHVIQIGYNGWLNSLGKGSMILPGCKAERIPGIPETLSALHHNCDWNDIARLQELEQHIGFELAAIVVAADYYNLEAGRTFYPYLREMADRCGAALIYDEIVTGFRLATAGVQEYFGVIPDMAVFAKGIANGMPLSVYCGRAFYMNQLEKTFVTSTLAGETLSLAAAAKVIEIYRTEPVIQHLWGISNLMWTGFNNLCRQYGIAAQVDKPMPVAFCRFESQELQNRLLRAICAHGVTFFGKGGYVNYSHREQDISEALERIEKAIKTL